MINSNQYTSTKKIQEALQGKQSTFEIHVHFSEEKMNADQTSKHNSAHRSAVYISAPEVTRAEQTHTKTTAFTSAAHQISDALRSRKKVTVTIQTKGNVDNHSKKKSAKPDQVLNLSTIASQFARCGLRNKNCNHNLVFKIAGCMNKASIKKFKSELAKHNIKHFEVHGSPQSVSFLA